MRMRSPLVLLLGLATIGGGVGGGCSSDSNGSDGGAGTGGGSAAQGGSTGSGGSSGTGGSSGSGGHSGYGGSPGSGGHMDAGVGPIFDGGTVDAGSMTCQPACGAGMVCVGTGTEGGFIILADAGVCPAGTHLAGIRDICTRDLTYACVPIPPACGGTATCGCAAATLCPTSNVCRTQTDGALQCVLQVP